MVANVKGARGGKADAGPDLGLLQAEAEAGELHIAQGRGIEVARIGVVRGEVGDSPVAVVEQGIGLAFVDRDVDRGWGGGGFASDVVGKACRGVLARGVVEETLVRDGEGGDAGIDLQRLPGEDALRGEFGEDLGVAGSVEDLLGDLPGDLVLAVAVGDAAEEDGREDQRAVKADRANRVVEDTLVGPLAEGLLLGFGEAEVDLGAEELVGTEVAVGKQELLGADEAEGVLEVARHGGLAAFAAGEGEGGDAGAEAAREEGEHAAVLVVGVGDDEHK